MFQLSINKDELLTPLMAIAGAVDKKQSLAVLSNFLLKINEKQLVVTATDLELEISATLQCESDQVASTTVPAKKFIDIIRSLDEQPQPVISYKDNTVRIKQGRSVFKLSTLAAENFPASEIEQNELEINLPRAEFYYLLQSSYFAMSQQDVRVFLNGLLLEFDRRLISAIATDGHRMAINRLNCENTEAELRYLLPRKAVLELMRLLNSIDDETVTLSAGKGHVAIRTQRYHFITKLIDSRFPAYNKAIPRNNDKLVKIDCASFKRSLSRIIILANEKSKAVTLSLEDGVLTLIANNQEQEEAVESLEAVTEGGEIKIGLNASYLLDVLNFLSDGEVHLSMSSAENSILIESPAHEHYQYILMPMKI